MEQAELKQIAILFMQFYSDLLCTIADVTSKNGLKEVHNEFGAFEICYNDTDEVYQAAWGRFIKTDEFKAWNTRTEGKGFCDLYKKECMGNYCSVTPYHEKCTERYPPHKTIKK